MTLCSDVSAAGLFVSPRPLGTILLGKMTSLSLDEKNNAGAELETDIDKLIVPLDDLPDESRQVLQQALQEDEIVQYVAKVYFLTMIVIINILFFDTNTDSTIAILLDF